MIVLEYYPQKERSVKKISCLRKVTSYTTGDLINVEKKDEMQDGRIL